MAFRPSFRRTHEEQAAEPNLTPIMNLMVVLIPLLLTSAEYIKIGIIELNLPPAAGPILQENFAPQETTRKLDLTVSITSDGFIVSSALSEIEPEAETQPTIPLREDGNYDFVALADLLYGIKQDAENKFSDGSTVNIQAEQTTDYQTLVSTMDASRVIIIDHREVPLFPDVSLSAGII